tara:strand:- start:74 stop:913 length:840 start_codon:yes stop_codon:yes gene_type:complete
MVDTEQREEELIEPTPYQNNYRRSLLDSDEEETKELNLSDLPEEANTQKDEGLISKKQEHDWQKRYSDLKSYHDRQRNEWQQEKELLDAKAKLSEKSASLATMPKTPEELEEFKNEYPDVYGVVETVSRLQAEAKTADIEKRIAALNQKEEVARYKTAEQELLVLHPDFINLKESPEFLAWLEEQPSTISNGIYKNRTDAKWASRVIDLYKMDTGNQPKPKSKKVDAAQAVSTTRKTVPSTGNEGKKIWTSSEIAKLKPDQFEKLEKEIEQASREGRII